MELSNQPPTISIITVTLNAGKYLEDTLQSVLSQKYTQWELIVIDGGSSDNTLNIIRKYSGNIAYWESHPDKGIYDAMNKGIKAARGKYITFLNAGDYYSDEFSLEQLFRDDPDYDIVYGDIYVVSDAGTKAVYQKAMDFTLENLLAHNTGVLCHQAMFVKKAVAPLYDLKYKYKAELNWYFDLVEMYPNLNFRHYDSPVVCYRLGGLGYVNFFSNLYELLKLIITRYGWMTFTKYRYPYIIRQKLRYRYPDFCRKYNI